MSRKAKTPLGIFIESIGLYFSNFDKFFKYMAFPVFGQYAGLLLVYGISLIYIKNLPSLLEKFPNLNSISGIIILTTIVLLPGLAIFSKAFWRYLIAYGAINSMLQNLLKSGRVYDFEAHNQLIKKRTITFLTIWFIIGCFSILAFCPLLWIIAGILAIFCILVFQVFTYKEDLSAIGCFKYSISLVKGHFMTTFMLICLAGALTYIFIPQLTLKLLTILKCDLLFINMFNPISYGIQLNSINPILEQYHLVALTPFKISAFLFEMFFAQILIQFTLPLRSILFGLWYKELDKENYSTQINKSSKKRPSEKLMENTHKKYGKKKLDRNLIERASKKDINPED